MAEVKTLVQDIDYSSVAVPAVINNSESEWEPPKHVYFGKKLPSGKMAKEPEYVYQEYPRMLYALIDGRVTAKVVNSDDEYAALGKGWEKTPAAFGILTAPSFEQARELAKAGKKAA